MSVIHQASAYCLSPVEHFGFFNPSTSDKQPRTILKQNPHHSLYHLITHYTQSPPKILGKKKEEERRKCITFPIRILSLLWEAMTIPDSASYYVHHQGTAESVMGLQGSARMNMLSNPSVHFHSNTGGNLMGSSLPLDTSSTMSPHGINVGQPPAISVGPHPAMLQGEPVRRKRGRPRKYGRDSAVSLALSPSTSSPVPFVRPNQKRRGRPPGSGRKQQQVSIGGSFFNGPGKLVPHIINVAVGEDIKRKILAFAQKQQPTVILSGNGTISAVNIRISSSGGSVTYEGRFDILSLSGSYAHMGVNAPHGPVGCLNVTLAGPDGRVIGGAVDGVMLAGSPVQVIVASLLSRSSKTKNIVGETSANPEDGTVGNIVTPANV